MAEKHPTEELVTLLTASQTRLRAYVMSLMADRELAMEVLQATNLVIWRKADQFQPGTNFIAWAFKIARLQALAHRTKAGRDRTVFSEAFVNELADFVEADGDADEQPRVQAALLECLDEVPEDRREMLWMRYRDNLRVPQIAERLGRKVDATRQMIHRLRVVLLRCVESKLSQGDVP
ncbi:RNA polymerase sigma factor CarQ [Planctomycetes bacterium MalM25]|nr:RNA polymerase sigma factor CarQ [Planctomycetes bacterium MalM25]